MILLFTCRIKPGTSLPTQHQIDMMESTNDASISPFRFGNRPYRATSLSSLASSSVAPTSIMGELTDDSISDNDSDGGAEISDRKEVDRFGFTGGNQYTDSSHFVLSVEKIRIREQKWLSMLNHWESWMSGKFSQVKNRCRKGIPPSLRGRAWQLLSGGKALCDQKPGEYAKYLEMKADSNCVEDIEKDLHRQFPFHEMFVQKGGTGQQDLRDVLRAYSVYNREDGYCQAQAPIAAVLLMHMPAEQAFWCVVAMCEHYLQGYFSPGLETIQIDGYVMQSLLRKVSSTAYKHLEKNQVTPVLYMTEWFMCVFSRTLPWTSVLRLWDMFFCEGIKVVFRCALVLLRNTIGTSEKVKASPGLYETMEALRKIDPEYLREDRLIFEIINLKISERDLEHEHKLQQIKWKKDKSSGPPIKTSGKETKRVYRYTPTFHTSSNSTQKSKHRSKQKISAISDNSAVIIKSTQDTKYRQRNRAKKKKRYQQNNTEPPAPKPDNNEVGSLASRYNDAPPDSQFEIKLSELNLDQDLKDNKGSNLTKTRQEIQEKSLPSSDVVQSHTPGQPSMANSSNSASDTKPSANDSRYPSEYINQRDELTVF